MKKRRWLIIYSRRGDVGHQFTVLAETCHRARRDFWDWLKEHNVDFDEYKINAIWPA